MTIASDLTLINTTKGNIKTAIEAKGVTVGTVPFADYPSKIAAITGGGAAVTEWTQAYYESVQAEADAAVAAAAWVRPADWLAMPTLAATEQKIVGLYPVFDSVNNWVAIGASGNAYTVDWGDGTVENFATGITATHNYVYSTISDTTASTRGYRQVLITVTPQSGQTLVGPDFAKGPTGFGNGFANNWLDIVMAMNNTSSINFANGTQKFPMLERFVWLGTNTQTSCATMFSGCRKLQVVSLDTANSTRFDNMFNGCNALRTIPLLNTSNGTRFDLMFANCTNLLTIPLIDVGKSTLFNSMFSACYNLITIPLLDLNGTGIKTSTAFTNMFTTCYSLRTIPQLDFSKAINFTSAFQNCRSLQYFPNINAPVCTNFTNMFNGSSLLETVGNITATAVTTFSGTFGSCTKLASVKSITTGTALTDMSSMFNGCRALVQIPLFDTQNVTTMDSTFYGCNTVTTVPAFNTVKVTTMSSCFRDCANLETVPEFSTAALTTIANIFNNCYSLKSIHTIGTNLLTNVGTSFTNCESLKTINLNCNATYIDSFQGCAQLETATITNYSTSQVINLAQTFLGLQNLREVAFVLPNGGKHTSALANVFQVSTVRKITGLEMGTATTSTNNTFASAFNLANVTLPGMVATLSVASCALGKAALVDLFNSLGTATAKTVTITGNWGAALLSADDRLIATNKGWTITG